MLHCWMTITIASLRRRKLKKVRQTVSLSRQREMWVWCQGGRDSESARGAHNNNNNNNNNNSIQRRILRWFTMSSLRLEPSPTRTLKCPGRNRVQIMCNTLSVYHVRHVVLRATWYEGTALLLSLTGFKSNSFNFILLAEPLTDANVPLTDMTEGEFLRISSIHMAGYLLLFLDRLAGLVVKASTSRAEDPRFKSRLRGEFFRVESYQ